MLTFNTKKAKETLIKAGLLEIIHTDSGKLYCTHEFYEKMNRK